MYDTTCPRFGEHFISKACVFFLKYRFVTKGTTERKIDYLRME